ncbi:MAG TPA: serine hydrolase domain-containing protein, partial [Gemmatimonadales bacterium]|nr:serine hydrolase domain-containing protein [Gemmatimonadales bacterium]
MNALTDLCFALVLVAGAAPCAAVSAQVGAVPRDSGPVFPATAIGGLGRGLIEAINTGDSAAQAAFVAAHLSREALETVPLRDRVAWLTRVAEQSGGLQVLEAKGGEPLEVLVKTRRGDHWARIWAFADPRFREKLGDYGAVPMRDPAVERSDVWPSRRLPEGEMLDEIGRHLAGAAERDEFSGVVLVAKGGRTILPRTYGLADRSWRIPNRLNTKFNLASMNKMFTAVAIAQLIEQGKLRLDDALATLLPNYPNQNAARRITVAHLLSHGGGLGTLFDRPGFDRRKRYRASRDYFPIFAAESLYFEPGAASAYSNEGYVVLGAIVERLTGMNYFDYVRERIFAPLDMRDTDSWAIDDVVPNLAVGYARFEDDPLGIGPRRPNWIFLQWKGSAAGGGYSTTGDLLKFVRGLREGRLVRRGLVDTLLAPHAKGDWYGYGFMLEDF